MNKHQSVRRTITVPVFTMEQAQELENLRQRYNDDYVSRLKPTLLPKSLWSLRMDVIRTAIIFGYDIETTPEELISDEYRKSKMYCNAINIEHAYRMGLVKAWNILRDGEPFPFEHPECNNSDESEK